MAKKAITLALQTGNNPTPRPTSFPRIVPNIKKILNDFICDETIHSETLAFLENHPYPTNQRIL